MNGNPVLQFPPGSRRQYVEKTGTFTWNYGQQGFKYTTGDQERIKQSGGQPRQNPPMQQMQQFNQMQQQPVQQMQQQFNPMQQMQQPMQQQFNPMQQMQQMQQPMRQQQFNPMQMMQQMMGH
jgi:FtsZ-interacting cell division protein ZipA